MEHYEVDIWDNQLKEEIKEVLRGALIESAVLPAVKSNTAVEVVCPSVVLTFEQQNKLLLLQMERDKLEIDKERVRQSLEREKIGLQQYRLDLIKAGIMVGNPEGPEWSGTPTKERLKGFDVVNNLRLIPRFDEKVPDTSFTLFERIADMRGWPDSDRVVMIQLVFTGKGQEAYSALRAAASQTYFTVKYAVLIAYELLPEAYRQHSGPGKRLIDRLMWKKKHFKIWRW